LSQTLTPVEAAKILKISTYTMYELIKRGEIPAQRIGRQLRVDPAVLDQYIHGTMNNYKNPKVIPPENPGKPSLCFIGSHDPAVELLFEFLKHTSIPIETSIAFKGSMDGLISLYNGEADITGIHLWDNDSQEYNISFVRHIIPNESFCIVNLVQRQQGFIVASGNPLHLETWDDLTKVGVRFINRQKGSGTRLRIDSFLQAEKISPNRIQGYTYEETTHTALACLIANGQADVGVGVKAAAKRLGLDFIPLFNERYDIVCLGKTTKTSIWNQLLNTLGSPGFIKAVHQQTGYDTSMTGKVLLNT
jgi:putative molybdopterin biosynthesis protein